ncbi:MAG: non-canonical purine NTP pyrophosphatase [Gemmatimonadetes bacterium]|nr:non-canonical purine NTP pyrophosphatase [Gemmatimonadota bacterium]
MRILFATRSAGKQREIRELAAGLPYEFVFPDDAGIFEQPEEENLENAETFEGNARRKAEFFARRSGLPTVAEDSGLEVLALGGAPGVRSKRFAGATHDVDTANNTELLRRLHGAAPLRRKARYRCVMVWIEHAGAAPRAFEGATDGVILEAPVGTGGFGYDPLFFSDEVGKTFAEAEPAEKHAVSHRGRAFQQFTAWLAGHPVGAGVR